MCPPGQKDMFFSSYKGFNFRRDYEHTMNTLGVLLPKYCGILGETRIAQFLECKRTPVSFATSSTTDQLWEIHDQALQNTDHQDQPSHQSLLDLKIELATRMYHACCFCERRCGVNREKATGKCGVKETRIASEFLHFGEEPMLVPSYTVFFSGCTFHCVFCQNWDISQTSGGTSVEPACLAAAINQRKRQGARNVNWVGGDPTSHLLFILSVLNETESNLPQVWNSNMYCSIETMKLLRGVMDVYLTDFKYGNDRCAQRLSKVEGYTMVVQRNHCLAYDQGEVIVRHLVMPHHGACCSQPALRWIKENLPQAVVNVMPQYRPCYRANDYEEIADATCMEEYVTIRDSAETLGLFLVE
jgi:putative pyruvate formate lyase activating enzyme